MSHFTVIVVGGNIEDQLAPYAENLMIEFQSQEKEYRHEYETQKTEVVMFKDGSWKWKFDNDFRKITQSLSSEYEYPLDTTLEEKYFKDLFPSFEEYVEEYHSQTDREEKFNEYGYWHNPNSKWDWYS